jgi:hypothetical protein
MRKVTTVLVSIGIGILTMYLLDPDRGSRRRAQVREKARKAAKAIDSAAKISSEISDRAQDVLA